VSVKTRSDLIKLVSIIFGENARERRFEGGSVGSGWVGEVRPEAEGVVPGLLAAA